MCIKVEFSFHILACFFFCRSRTCGTSHDGRLGSSVWRFGLRFLQVNEKLKFPVFLCLNCFFKSFRTRSKWSSELCWHKIRNDGPELQPFCSSTSEDSIWFWSRAFLEFQQGNISPIFSTVHGLYSSIDWWLFPFRWTFRSCIVSFHGMTDPV